MTIDVETMGEPHVSEANGPESIEDLFLANLTDKETLSKDSEDDHLEPAQDDDEDEPEDEETLSEGSDEDSDGETESSEDTTESTPKTKKVQASDDDVFEVDGTEVSFRDIKRSLGREKALTQKEQAVSETKRRADEKLAEYTSSVSHHLDLAKKAYEPYIGVNFVAMGVSGEWTPDEIAVAMKNEQVARDNLEYFHHASERVKQDRVADEQRVKQETEQNYIAARNECAKVLGSKGWDGKLHLEVAKYYADQGVEPERLNALVQPAEWEILRDAMRYRKGQKALETKTVKPVSKNAPRVIKSAAEPVTKSKSDNVNKAMDRLKRDGSSESVQNAFLARLTAGDR